MTIRFFHGIRTKLVGMLCVVGLALIALLSILAHETLTKDFLALEKAQVLRNITRTNHAFSLKTQELSNYAKDWSNWDDAYQYAVDKNSAFETSSLPETLFVARNIDFIAFYRPDRSLIVGYERKKNSNERISMSPDIAASLADPKNMFLVEIKNGGSVEGVLLTSEGPLSLVSQPILKSSGDGPSRGWLLFGAFVNAAFVGEMAKITQLPLMLEQENSDPFGPESLQGMTLHEETIHLHMPFKDSKGSQAFVVTANLPRDIMKQGRRTIFWTSLSMSVVALLFVLIVFTMLNQLLLRRIRRFAKVSENITSNLNFSLRVHDTGNDEITALSTNFNRMVEAVERHTENTRRILDNVSFGFFLLDKSLNICNGHSQSCLSLLQREKLAGTTMSEAFHLSAQESIKLQETLRIVFSGEIPDDLSLAMLPLKFRVGANTLRCTAKTVRGKSGDIEHLLFSVVDITELVLVERDYRENQSIIRALRFQQAFHDFAKEASHSFGRIRDAIAANDDITTRKILHTLKSAFGFFLFVDIVEYIHQLEDEPKITAQRVNDIELFFLQFVSRNQSLLHSEENDLGNHCGACENIKLLEKVIESPSMTADEMRSQVRAFCQDARLTPISKLIKTLPAFVEHVALDQCKNVGFVIEGDHLRAPKQLMDKILFVLPLLIKNAIVHGIEAPYERGTKGETGRLVLSFTKNDKSNEFIVELKDDGRGLERENVLRLAMAKGWTSPLNASALTDDEIFGFLFVEGFSMAPAPTAHAGRGMGLGAARETIESLGGKLVLKKNSWGGMSAEITLPIQEWGLS